MHAALGKQRMKQEAPASDEADPKTTAPDSICQPDHGLLRNSCTIDFPRSGNIGGVALSRKEFRCLARTPRTMQTRP